MKKGGALAATVIVGLAGVAWIGPAVDAGDFVALESGHVVEYRGVSRGAAWGDFDGDGDPDLFVSHPTYDGAEQRNALYRNDDGVLTLQPESPVATAPPGGWEGAAWVDVDGDGDLDLHTVGRLGAGSLFFENEGGRLTRRAVDPLGGAVGSASMACWADADLDGLLDVFLVGYRNDPNRLFRNRGNWVMEPVALPPAGAGEGAGRACVWVDLDEDRLPELVVANARQPNVLLRNGGSMTLRPDTTSPLSRDEAYGYGISAADVNGDGRPDLFVANFDDDNALLLNDGAGRLRLVDTGATPQSAASKGHVWGDFDLDGILDLYLGSGTPAPGMLNRLWVGVGDGRFRLDSDGDLAVHQDTSAAIAGADFDLDGDLDLFVANWGGAGSVDRLYVNTQEGGSWLAIDLEGVRSNRTGVGAHVAVRVSNGSGAVRWLHRWHVASTGYAGQNEPRLHFGLGPDAAVDSVVVRWPSGEVTRLGTVQADARLSIREGG